MFSLDVFHIRAYIVYPLKAAIIRAEAERSVLQKALEQKMERLLFMEEENRRLTKQQRQMLKQGQAEVQKMLPEVKEEKFKLKVLIQSYLYVYLEPTTCFIFVSVCAYMSIRTQVLVAWKVHVFQHLSLDTVFKLMCMRVCVYVLAFIMCVCVCVCMHSSCVYACMYACLPSYMHA